MKKLLAMLLAAAMSIGTASVALADEKDLFAIGSQTYATLGDAVKAASGMEGTVTIRMLDNASGGGVVVQSDSDIVLDFGGYTYTVGAPTVGSIGTETNGFQLLRDSNVIMRNGTIKASDYLDLRILIQNYSDLTLENMTLDARTATRCDYAASNNFGSLTVTGDSNIYAQPGQKAFDVYYWPSNGYGDGVTVTIDTTGEIVGDVEYGSDGSGTANVAEKAKLKVENGKIDGAISTYGLGTDNKTGINVTGGLFTDASWNNDEYTENAEVIAELKNDGETEAFHIGGTGDVIDATNYDAVEVTKAKDGTVKVVGEDVAVENGTDKALTVNGANVPVDGEVVVNRAPREDTGGDYFGNAKWAEVKREIAAAEEGDTIKVSATGLPWFPSSVARALKGRDITLEVRKNGVTYSINGLEIGAIEKIWYEFDQIETELLTVEAE